MILSFYWISLSWKLVVNPR